MNNKHRIETATADDIPALISLARCIWHAHYPGIITVEQINYMLAQGYTVEKITAEMTTEDITWLKILDGTTMIGFAAFGPYGEKQIKLHKLYLDVDHHSQGIGTAALAEVEQRAVAKGATSIVLNVNKDNHKAIKSYRRNGYQVAESVTITIGSGFVMDDYVMRKELAPS
jgi:ribosomal protein S18 acetylase RimI-like enzyme